MIERSRIFAGREPTAPPRVLEIAIPIRRGESAMTRAILYWLALFVVAGILAS